MLTVERSRSRSWSTCRAKSTVMAVLESEANAERRVRQPSSSLTFESIFDAKWMATSRGKVEPVDFRLSSPGWRRASPCRAAADPAIKPHSKRFREALFQAWNVLRDRVGCEDDLTVSLVKGVEGVEELSPGYVHDSLGNWTSSMMRTSIFRNVDLNSSIRSRRSAVMSWVMNGSALR